MHAAIRGAVGIPFKPNFTDRPVNGNERWKLVGCAIHRRDCGLRIHLRTTASCRWKIVTTRTTVHIETRAQARALFTGHRAIDRIDLLKYVRAGIEQGELLRS